MSRIKGRTRVGMVFWMVSFQTFDLNFIEQLSSFTHLSASEECLQETQWMFDKVSTLPTWCTSEARMNTLKLTMNVLIPSLGLEPRLWVSLCGLRPWPSGSTPPAECWPLPRRPALDRPAPRLRHTTRRTYHN
eukprot:317843-Amphidinium_carterae.1